jgi:hypothetical protein
MAFGRFLLAVVKVAKAGIFQFNHALFNMLLAVWSAANPIR